ncbi:hypothetical protein EPN44_14300 [bacterium]|nr:MAG: hypothetical protein EPN44_14300 [bacterium]
MSTTKKEVWIYLVALIASAVVGAVIAMQVRWSPVLARTAFVACLAVGVVVTFVTRAIVHALTPNALDNERGQLTIGDLVGFALLAGLFVLGVMNLQFLEEYGAGIQGMIMLGYSANATDQFEGLYHQLPCPGSTCSVTPTAYTPTGATSSPVLPYAPHAWGDATNANFTLADQSVAGGPTQYQISDPRQYDTRVVQALAQSGYTGSQTHLAMISGQGIVAEP